MYPKIPHILAVSVDGVWVVRVRVFCGVRKAQWQSRRSERCVGRRDGSGVVWSDEVEVFQRASVLCWMMTTSRETG
jgi:hypothetical protein